MDPFIIKVLLQPRIMLVGEELQMIEYVSPKNS
ncbi:MAG: hypothetical protein UX41_C0015G0029, partial [Candidatus Collierbacteria bacterium GW2011_GWE1_46_18]